MLAWRSRHVKHVGNKTKASMEHAAGAACSLKRHVPGLAAAHPALLNQSALLGSLHPRPRLLLFGWYSLTPPTLLLYRAASDATGNPGSVPLSMCIMITLSSLPPAPWAHEICREWRSVSHQNSQRSGSFRSSRRPCVQQPWSAVEHNFTPGQWPVLGHFYKYAIVIALNLLQVYFL